MRNGDYLKHDSLMPFGKHKGMKMRDISAKYLIWLFETSNAGKSVSQYVISNREELDARAREEN